MCYEIDAWVTAVPMVFVGITTLTAAVLSIKNIFWPMAMKPGTHFQSLLDSVLMSIFIVGVVLVLFEAARRCWKTLHGGPIPPEAFGSPEAKIIAPKGRGSRTDGSFRRMLLKTARVSQRLGSAPRRGARIMPIAKELTIRIEYKPGTLAQCCRPLAERDVNILAFQAFEREGQSLIRMVVDDPATAKKLLDADRIYYTETEVAQVALPHRSGELFRAVSRLGEASLISTTPIAEQSRDRTCRWWCSVSLT